MNQSLINDPCDAKGFTVWAPYFEHSTGARISDSIRRLGAYIKKFTYNVLNKYLGNTISKINQDIQPTKACSLYA